MDYAANAFSHMHEIEGSIDVFWTHRVGNHFVDLYFTLQVIIHVGWKFGSPVNSPKRCTFPNSAGDQLIGPSLNHLTCARYTNNNGLTPAHSAALQRGLH